MNLSDLQFDWNELAATDPLWAILAEPNAQGNRWPIDQFMQTGKQEIDDFLTHTSRLGVHMERRRALDFGCGVGRLTQALANHFDEVFGVDISPRMLELAAGYNRRGNRCRYFLNAADNLSLFGDHHFDLVYSRITLQHMPPRYSKKYIKEFLRLLFPEGLLVFQLPSHFADPSKVLHLKRRIRHLAPTPVLRLYRRARRLPGVEMYGIPQEQLIRFLEQQGGRVLDVQQDPAGGGGEWLSFRYWVTKRDSTR
jgi:ubiquinone/menaquinone biosynthesis C-methylase UbiE